VALTCAPYYDLACAETSELRRLAKRAHKLEQIWRSTKASISESALKHDDGRRITQLTTALPGVEAVLVFDVAKCELICWDLRKLNGLSAGMSVGKTILNESTIVSERSTPNSYFIAYLTSETTEFAAQRYVSKIHMEVNLLLPTELSTFRYCGLNSVMMFRQSRSVGPAPWMLLKGRPGASALRIFFWTLVL
jgi:hypothetical protein